MKFSVKISNKKLFQNMNANLSVKTAVFVKLM
jgi:hypothetical protein